MILACPSCGARFLVGEGEVGPEGRGVRCGRCGRSWRARPGGARKPRRRRWALWTVATLAAAVGAGAALDRDRAAAAWRGAAALYAGLAAELAARVDPPGAGLELRIASSERSTGGGREVLRVAGRIRNPGQYPRPVPGLRIVLRDAGGRALQARTFPAPAARLGPYDSADFALDLDDPAPAAASISVSFHETADEAR